MPPVTLAEIIAAYKARSSTSREAVLSELRGSAKVWLDSPDEECQEDAVTLVLMCDLLEAL